MPFFRHNGRTPNHSASYAYRPPTPNLRAEDNSLWTVYAVKSGKLKVYRKDNPAEKHVIRKADHLANAKKDSLLKGDIEKWIWLFKE